jgi:hypothetical protein
MQDGMWRDEMVTTCSAHSSVICATSGISRSEILSLVTCKT